MWTPGGPGIFWKPWMANYVAAGVFFLFFRKMAPYFWKPWMANYVAAGVFFFQKNGPIFLEALNG